MMFLGSKFGGEKDTTPFENASDHYSGEALAEVCCIPCVFLVHCCFHEFFK